MDRLEDVCSILKELAGVTELRMELSDSDTLCSLCSPLEFSTNFDQEMDNQLKRFSFDSSEAPPKAQTNQRRKIIKPGCTISRKTEIKDKYWLSGFRSFIKTNLVQLKPLVTKQQLDFWKLYISKSGKPGRSGQFASYNKAYRAFLFKEPSFRVAFKAWFVEFGKKELKKIYKKGTDLWVLFYEYAANEIAVEKGDFELYRKSFKGLNGEKEREVFYQIIKA